jgi:SNF-related kinase
VKLTDFGFSNKFVPGRKLETSCGSLAYSAPEILLGDSYDAPAVDIWSLGVILYMLVCGEPPFQEANDSETLTMIMDCRYRIPDRVSRLCQDIIGRMLVREPSQRATLSDIAAHPWMTSQLDSAAASSHVGNSSPSPSPPLLLSSNAAPVVTSTTPLVCHETLSDEDHCHIVQRIVDGKIATRDEVLGSLESSAYNYITATYYLLAERMLRKRVEAAASSQQLDGTTSGESSNGTSVALTPVLSPLMLSPRMSLPMSDGHHSIVDSLISPTGVTHLPSSPAPVPHGPMSPSAVLHSEINLLMCRCAMIHEDSLEVGTVDDADDDEGTNITMIDQTHSDSEVTADEGAGSDSCESLAPLGNLLEIPSMRGSKLASGISRPLVSVRSSPQLLNEICEEAESVDNEDEAPNSGSGIVATPASHFLRRHSTEMPRHLERLHRVHRRKLATLVPRVASCSSSDASDTDEAEQRKHRKHKTTTTHGATPSCIKNLGRRDSSEHSSDNDNQPPAVGGGDSGSVPSSSTGLLGSGGSTQRHESQHSGDRHRGGHMDSLHEHHMETGYSSDISVSTDINELADGCAPWDIGYLPSQRFSDCHLSDRRRRRGCGIGGIFRDPSVVSDWQQMNERNQLSNVMRFCSNEFGQFVEKLGPARPAAGGNISGGGSIPFSSGMKRWQSAGKFHSHSKVDLRRETHAVAAALLARLSGTDVLRCRLRTRKVSL